MVDLSSIGQYLSGVIPGMGSPPPIAPIAGAPGAGMAPIAGAPGAGIAPLPYDQQLLEIKRQQALADALRQQTAEQIPIQTSSRTGTQAPIPWAAVLAKALTGYEEGTDEAKAKKMQAGLGAQDQAAIDQTVAKLRQQQNGVGMPSMPGTTTQINAPIPTLPGQPGPMAAPQGGPPGAPPQGMPPGGPSATLNAMPAQQGTGPTQAPMSLDDQLMTILQMPSAGPRTQQFQSVMGGIVGQQIAAQKAAELQRQNAVWEAQNVPASQARLQEIQAQAAAQQQTAAATNKLPMSQFEQAQMAAKAREDAELHNYHMAMTGMGYTADGLPNPAVQSWVKMIQSGGATMNQVPAGLRTPVASAIAGAPKETFTPTAAQRFATASTKMAAQYMKLPNYANTAQGLPLLQRIDAALKTPGSVGDQELLDAFTMLSKNGGNVTEGQVGLITHGQSLSDWANVQMQKLKNGGVLSDQQRQDIRDIANHTYEKYKSGYQPIYDQVTKNLSDAGIPKQFWTIPDLNTLNAGQGISKAAAAPGGAAPHPQDQAAIAWARANPRDPRASAILSANGVQ